MKGYVMNVSAMWVHAMKRSIGPGAKISLNELFEQYGVKHELKEGDEFASWLMDVKLKDRNKWKVVVEDDKVESVTAEEPKELEAAQTMTLPLTKTEPTVEDVVTMSVRQAREKLPRITDLKLLKYAMQEANQLAGKDSLCKLIRKRIRDLQVAR